MIRNHHRKNSSLRCSIRERWTNGNSLSRWHIALVVSVTLVTFSGVRAQDKQPIYDGFTEPKSTVLIAAMELGRLETVNVIVGQKVTAGDAVATLENELQAFGVKMARAQMSMQSEADATMAERDLQLSRVENLRKLSQQSMTRPDELLRAETDLRISEARYGAAQEQELMRKLELERAELQLARRIVRSPASGTITEVLRQPGEYVTPNDASVVRLVVTDVIYAVFNVPDVDIPRMHLGDSVSVFLRSTGQSVTAKIESIGPVIDDESGTIRVRVALDNADGRFRVGDRASMRIVPGDNQSAVNPRRTVK
jgi:RND family efflux transporter MFP subunit